MTPNHPRSFLAGAARRFKTLADQFSTLSLALEFPLPFQCEAWHVPAPMLIDKLSQYIRNHC